MSDFTVFQISGNEQNSLTRCCYVKNTDKASKSRRALAVYTSGTLHYLPDRLNLRCPKERVIDQSSTRNVTMEQIFILLADVKAVT